MCLFFFSNTNFEFVNVLKEQEAKVWNLNGANNTTIINTYNHYPWCEAYPTHPGVY